MLEVTVHFEGYQVAPFFYEAGWSELSDDISTHNSHGMIRIFGNDGQGRLFNRERVTHITIREVTPPA